jgi:hypothetical protein
MHAAFAQLHHHPSDRGVGGMRQRRVPAVARPIAVADEIRVCRGDLAQRLEVVARNGVDRLDGSGELRPARRPVAASEDELRVGERRDRGIDPPGMELAEVVERRRRPRADVAQQVLRLVAQLIEMWTERELASGHTSLLHARPLSARSG